MRTIQAVFNLANYMIGAGILGLPWAFAKAGLLGGILLFVACAALSVFSMFCLINAAEHHHSYQYEELIVKWKGHMMRRAVSIIIVLDTIGTLGAYIRIISDAIVAVRPKDWSISDGSLTLIACAVFLIPPCFVRNLSKLSWASFLSLLPTLFLMGLLVFRLVDSASPAIVLVSDQAWLAPPIMVFALYCHLAILPLYRSFYPTPVPEADPDAIELGPVPPSAAEVATAKQDIRTVLFSTTAVVSIVYLFAGIAGNLLFGAAANSNLLFNFTQPLQLYPLVITNAFAILIGFPIVLFTCRLSLHRLFSAEDGSYRVFILENVLIVCCAFVIGFFSSRLTDILGLTGSLFQTLLAFFLPCILYLGLVPAANRAGWQTASAYGVMVLAAIVGPLCFIVTLLSLI